MENQDTDSIQMRGHIVPAAGMMISQYRIVEKIGAGGMGESYLPGDTKPDDELNQYCKSRYL